jgi:hypothetical protein
MKCYWINNKECPHLEECLNEKFEIIKHKNVAMLSYFTIKEICDTCLKVIDISLKNKI